MKDKQPIRVLIVEDNILVGELIEGILKKLGYHVVGLAYDGFQSLKAMDRLVDTPDRPDVILMDIEMPGMNGIEASRHIQARYPTPVVMLTAYDEPDLVGEASEAGAGAYLLKPPNIGELERAIVIAIARFDDMIELRRLNAELQAALDQVRTLSGLLPICAACKKIRDDQGYWHQVESYIQEHSDAKFSHGICPDCARKLYPEYFDAFEDELETDG
jgi:AmiR/NasT family two-component response regulator